ncbi:3-methyladenine DNA glycosylase, partial [Arthrobacter deserti]|nr:3-methyladenine DNA glycosylase [Arthrobacter deserti]
PGGTAVILDAAAFLADRSATVDFVRVILAGTAARPARLSCFGL